jgi:hypothetical protein
MDVVTLTSLSTVGPFLPPLESTRGRQQRDVLQAAGANTRAWHHRWNCSCGDVYGRACRASLVDPAEVAVALQPGSATEFHREKHWGEVACSEQTNKHGVNFPSTTCYAKHERGNNEDRHRKSNRRF